MSEGMRTPRVRYRRQAENVFETLEHEIEKDADMISDKTGMPTWSGTATSRYK